MKHKHLQKEYQDEFHIWVTKGVTESTIKLTFDLETVKSAFA